jgi:hypothetical protein
MNSLESQSGFSRPSSWLYRQESVGGRSCDVTLTMQSASLTYVSVQSSALGVAKRKERNSTMVNGHDQILYIHIRLFWNSVHKKLHGLSPREDCTDRATAACRRSLCQFLQIEGATWSAWRILTAAFHKFNYFSFSTLSLLN